MTPPPALSRSSHRHHRRKTMKVVAFYMLLSAVAAAVLTSASAAPSAAHAVFLRSCSDCGPEEFCEFAYPGAPAGSVACLKYRSTVHLYRHYDDAFAQCGTGSGCCGTFLSNEDPSNLDACTAACRDNAGCAYFTYDTTSSPKVCSLYSGCAKFAAASGTEPVYTEPVYARGANACPTAAGCPT
ncbi:hypothetical protein DFJ74DRAFT_393783 [Hyaloraphidium curvatum]|nr:hypothetical protein DFJ74DRAFT_393783 [Hyaloraphidium curvatum]